MSNISINTTTTIETNFIYTTSNQANRIKFGVLVTLQLLSIPCSLYIFYQFDRQRQFRESFHHHAILLLLFITIALPFTQAYMYTSYVYPTNPIFCSFWNWFHYSLNIINLFLMGFASIERNWLIFHPWLVRSKPGKILFHYCPLLFCLFYPPLFYMGIIFIFVFIRCREHSVSCQNSTESFAISK